jgi:hypothetical protein
VAERATARVKRVEIEIRNLRAAISQPATADQAARLQELERQVTELRVEAEAKRTDAAQAKHRLKQASAAVDRAQDALRRVDSDKRALEDRTGKSLGAHGVAVSQAKSEEQQRWIRLARSVLAAQDTGLLSDQNIAELTAHERSVQVAALELERHVRALGAYDRPSVASGYRVAALCLAVLLALLMVIRWF